MLEPFSFAALEWADEYIERTGRWPRRRFRIEVPMADGGRLRTRLLTWHAATLHPSFQHGVLIEVIPPPTRRRHA